MCKANKQLNSKINGGEQTKLLISEEETQMKKESRRHAALKNQILIDVPKIISKEGETLEEKKRRAAAVEKQQPKVRSKN